MVEIADKINAFENYDGSSLVKLTLHIFALFIFLAGHFSLLIAVIHFILCSGYHFANGI